MKNHIRAALSVVVILVACSSPPRTQTGDAMRTVTYRNETIQLSRAYEDFHDYRDDPNNLPPFEVSRVARLVRSAPVPSAFASRKEADDTFISLMFPGYGLSMLQLHDPVALYSIEIPQMEESRWVALMEKNGRWVVVDDFLWPISSGYLSQAMYTNGSLTYFDRSGRVLRERK